MTQDLFAHEPGHSAQGPSLISWSPDTWSVQPDWRPVLDAFWQSPQGTHLATFIQQRLTAGAVIYPPEPLRALALTSLKNVKVVVVGQDPYHGPGQAEGLAFSVAPGVAIPPSLRNIFKELQRDLHLPSPSSGSLKTWAERGVLLLNTALTVEQGMPASHAGQGWEVLTDGLIKAVAQQTSACVYLLWGAHAQAKASMIEATSAAHGGRALILCANHPSPLSATRGPQPFIGCGHFSAAQQWLAQQNQALRWNL